MKNALLVLQLALGLVPSVLAVIQAVEVPGSGAAKLETVSGIILAAFELLPEDIRRQIGADKILPFAKQVISLLVTLLNVTGQFKKV